MKNIIYIIIVTFSSSLAHANVVEKVEFESILEKRIEKGLSIFDKTLRADVTVGYIKYESLPGTVMEGAENISPVTLDEQDIAKIYITITSQLEKVPDELKSKAYKLVPVPRHRIALKFEHKPVEQVIAPVAVEPQHLSNNVQALSDNLAKIFFIGIGAILFLSFAYGYIIHRKNMSSFKTKFNELIEALQNSSQGTQRTPLTSSSENSSTLLPSNTLASSQNILNELTLDALIELFSDCYWCEEDSYAHWLWNNISVENKKSLLGNLKYFKAYVTHFMNMAPSNKAMHDHPYYLQPLLLRYTSQDDLKREIKKNKHIWNALSPVRQQHLEFPIIEKLSLVSSEAQENIQWQFQKSVNMRQLHTDKKIGSISLQDEAVLFNKPDLVPKTWRKNIPSLIWLAQRDTAYISQTLSMYDARALASAWISTPDVIEKLERCLPEKKLKLVQSYVLKTPPSKDSPIFHDLFVAGISNEAA